MTQAKTVIQTASVKHLGISITALLIVAGNVASVISAV